MALGRLIFLFGILAGLALIGTALLGYGLFGPPADRQFVHSLLAFVAVLSAVFANGWFVLFLWGSGRWLRRLAQGREGMAGALAAARRSGRLAGWMAFLATLAFVAGFVSGNLSFGSRSWRLTHHALFLLALLLQAAALWLERQALQADDRLAIALETPADLGPARAPHVA